MPAALTGALATSIALGLAPPTVGAANAASTRAGTSTSSADFFASEIKNINDGPDGSSPGSFAESNGTMFFAAKDADAGRELWKTNGNAGGTTRVKDILPGAGGSYPSNLTDVNGTLFFTATDGSNGYELWKSRRDRGRDRAGQGHPDRQRRFQPGASDECERNVVLHRHRRLERLRALEVGRDSGRDRAGQGHPEWRVR